MLYSKEQVINNVLYGVVLGYSHCCIKYFHLRQVNGDMVKEMHNPTERKLTGTGFICCDACNSKYSEKELISNINSNRMIKDKFSQNANFDDTLFEKAWEKDSTKKIFFETVKEIEKYIQLEG